MSSRAESAQRTGEAILAAMLSCFAATPYDRLRLEDVASRAGVTVQTVIRRFGGKDGLMLAVSVRELERMRERRGAPTPGDLGASIRSLTAFYEHYGPLITKFNAEGRLVDVLEPVVEAGRAFHLDWCRDAFAPQLDRAPEGQQHLLLAQVVAACDVWFWEMLTTDGGLSAADAAIALDHTSMRSCRPEPRPPHERLPNSGPSPGVSQGSAQRHPGWAFWWLASRGTETGQTTP